MVIGGTLRIICSSLSVWGRVWGGSNIHQELEEEEKEEQGEEQEEEGEEEEEQGEREGAGGERGCGGGGAA